MRENSEVVMKFTQIKCDDLGTQSTVYLYILVGGVNPSEKSWKSVRITIPNILKKTCSKPPTRYTWWIDVYEPNLYGKIYALGIKWYNVVPHS